MVFRLCNRRYRMPAAMTATPTTTTGRIESRERGPLLDIFSAPTSFIHERKNEHEAPRGTG
jgi:hypothetical protein